MGQMLAALLQTQRGRPRCGEVNIKMEGDESEGGRGAGRCSDVSDNESGSRLVCRG